MLLRVTADDVIAGRVFIHHAKEHFLDTRAFLVDGIIQRVDQVFHTLNDLLLVHHLCRCHIITCKFLTIICQTFELDTLRMCQEQQIHSLMHRLQLHLLLIVFQDETIILRNNQTTQTTLGSFYPPCSKRSVLPSACNWLTSLFTSCARSSGVSSSFILLLPS